MPRDLCAHRVFSAYRQWTLFFSGHFPWKIEMGSQHWRGSRSTVEHVVSWMVDAGAEVDSEGTFGNVIGVQGLLESEENSLVFKDS